MAWLPLSTPKASSTQPARFIRNIVSKSTVSTLDMEDHRKIVCKICTITHNPALDRT
ncbi:hypothetical protein [Methanothrix soehngenii]|jgi:hypothetical protein